MTRLSVLKDGISINFLPPEPDVGIALEHLGVLADIQAAVKLAAGAN